MAANTLTENADFCLQVGDVIARFTRLLSLSLYLSNHTPNRLQFLPKADIDSGNGMMV